MFLARRATTAALAGAAFTLTLAFCSTAGAEPAPTTTSVAPATTTTAPAPKPARKVVLIGTAESARSSTAFQQGAVQPVGRAAIGAPRTLPHTGTASVWLAALGLTLVLAGGLATRCHERELTAIPIRTRERR